MKALMQQLRTVHTPGCVTIAFNTHRTYPENQADGIRLKNGISDAKGRLKEQYDSEIVAVVTDRLTPLLKEVDHTINLDSMLIFANPELLKIVRLPVTVVDRVEVGEAFSVRDLVEAENESSSYYVMVLSRRAARLVEAYNGKVVRTEIEGFPIQNDVVELDPLKLTMASGADNLIENFFKQVDNRLTGVLNSNRLGCVITTEERNYHHFMKVTSNSKSIIGHLNRNRDDEENKLIVAAAWPLVHAELKELNNERMGDLRDAVSSGKFLSDINDIARAVGEGRGRTLFVQTGYYQPALLKEGFIDVNGQKEKGFGWSDDVVEEIITEAIGLGGDVVFIDGKELDKFEGLALLTRY